MTDSAGAERANGGEQPQQAAHGIVQQYVKDLSFESPRSPGVFITPPDQPEINVNVDVSTEKVRENLYEVTLTIELRARAGGEAVFLVELAYAGLCQIGNLPAPQLEATLMVEVPRLLFPFARAVLANCIRDGAFPPLMLNPIDFMALYRQRKAAAAAESEGGEGTAAPQGSA